MNRMSATYSYSRTTYIQWKLGFVVLFLFLLFVLGNSDLYQRNVGLLIFVCLAVYGVLLYDKFLKDPSEILIINNNQIILKFRKAQDKLLKYEEVEYIKKSNNPFFDYVKGKLEIKIRNSDKKFRISGNIQNFDSLVRSLIDCGFEIRE